jgi:hypothetical protein
MTSTSPLAQAEEILALIHTLEILQIQSGQEYLSNFKESIENANEMIDFYKKFPLSSLRHFTFSQLQIITMTASNDYGILTEAVRYSNQPGLVSDQKSLFGMKLIQSKTETFDKLWQYLAYSVAWASNLNSIEQKTDRIFLRIKEEAHNLSEEFAKKKSDFEDVLINMRSIATESGVSKQASFFKIEADEQEKKSLIWLITIYVMAAVVIGFAIGVLFVNKLDWFSTIKPTNQIELIQFTTSKILIFATLSFLLILSSKNYGIHKHNAVVNRHRQNALFTYRAIIEAASNRGTEDIVLAHAASCIFAPQDTGYSKNGGDGSSKSVLELFTKGSSKGSDN